MAVLDFGWKRIIKRSIIYCVGWIVVIIILDLFEVNNLNNLLDEHIHFSVRPVKYLLIFPVLFILLTQFFDKNFIRIEVVDSKLILTGLQFFHIHTKEIKMEEGMTYMITRKNGLRTTLMRYVRIYIKGDQVYVIKEVI